jgi:hypothetical protein
MKTKKAITNEIGDQKRETGKKNEDRKTKSFFKGRRENFLDDKLKSYCISMKKFFV